MKRKIDEHSLQALGCKCYRPGDPEFETVANLVTPLHKIRSAFSSKKSLFFEEKSDYGWKRNESINELYATML